MSAGFEFEDRNGYTFCRYAGRFEAGALLALTAGLSRYCAERGSDRALVDVTGSEGQVSVLDRFEHGDAMTGIWDPAIRLAVVGRDDQVLPDRFWETVTRNRGLNTFVTTDLEAAVSWLRADRS